MQQSSAAGTAAWRHALTAGRAVYPGITVDPARLERRVQVMSPSLADVEARGAEIFLCAACAERDSGAIAVLDARFLSQADRHVRRITSSPWQVDEIRQRVRIGLLAGDRPAIATFTGRSPLDAWLRVVFVREAVRLVGGERRQLEGDRDEPEQIAMLLGEAGAPPDRVVDDSVRRPLRAALEQALLGLSPRDRLVLRLHFVDGLNIGVIGDLFRVHRATVARWLVRLRAELFRGVRRYLTCELRPTQSELRSLMRRARGDLQLSLERLLAGDGPDHLAAAVVTRAGPLPQMVKSGRE